MTSTQTQATRKQAPAQHPEHLEAEGFLLLPGGVTRMIRVNQNFVRKGEEYADEAFLVIDDERVSFHAEVIVLGHSRLAKRAAHPSCGGNSSAWLETDAPLAVR